ncbi:type I phosphomannose isomerase catalytic subunit [Wenzhouxiangella sp. EGI_FJ10409]|uniref:type I phosphomannose isomerase catalytic subunit n=1 Tax=Wenzhouxiangella sp. EGI_FJ10409 TaxID=3243767 RepID=UPI0035D82968
MSVLRFRPVCQTRVWGGRKCESLLGRELPGSDPIGESWEIVDRPEAQSTDIGTGRTLRELLETDAASIMGPGYEPNQPFPVLVKWLDCSDRLSLQVHPPKAVAERLGGEPKTECWYIADATDDAALIVGLRHGVTRQQFEEGIEHEALEPLLHRFPVRKGQAMLLESGRLHAIDAGNLILEIQQNSDTTYRVYDWGRKGLEGKPRQLHVGESLQSIDFDDIEPHPLPPMTAPGERTIADCPALRIRQQNLRAGESIQFESGQQPRILSLVQGRLLGEGGQLAVNAFENVLVPYTSTCSLKADGPCTLLITDNFV